jgi:DNA-binding CsgD family transcriptional regulator
VLSPDVSEALAADRLAGPSDVIRDLSAREAEILRLLASGMDSEEIAPLLNLSLKTVRNHHYAIKPKIGARNDAQLVWIAARADLVQMGVADPLRRTTEQRTTAAVHALLLCRAKCPPCASFLPSTRSHRSPRLLGHPSTA